MVTSQKMKETEMGDRGSKSITVYPAGHKSVIVKEQRVDGSWYNNGVMYLRCILVGFERNYQVKIPSKQINKRNYTSIASPQSQYLRICP